MGVLKIVFIFLYKITYCFFSQKTKQNIFDSLYGVLGSLQTQCGGLLAALQPAEPVIPGSNSALLSDAPRGAAGFPV